MIVSLRSAGAAGEKMWQAESTDSGVVIKFGSVGKKPRSQHIPLSKCTNRSPEEELLKKAEQKRSSGFWDVEPDMSITVGQDAEIRQPKATANNASSAFGMAGVKPHEWF